MNKMLGYLKDYKRESVLAPLFKMLEATFDLFVPLVMADIVNIGIAAHDFHYILVRCGILLLLAMIGLACSLTAQYFSAKAAVGYSTALRHALFEHIQTLSFTEMDTLGKAGKNASPIQYAWKALMENLQADLPVKEFAKGENVVEKHFDTSTGAIISSGGSVGYYTEDNLPDNSYTVSEDDPYAALAQAAADAAAAGDTTTEPTE